jgi:hypothetical protein
MRRSSSASPSTSKLSTTNFSTLIFCILILSTLNFAATPDRITAPIAAAQSVRLAAGVPLQARPEFDQGAVEPSMKMNHMTVLTAPSAAQQRAMNKLLADQQNPHSASYHKWLTPEQYADRFGLSSNDVKKISAWLETRGFTITETARGRNWIVFSGTAAQVERAFQTEIHTFKVNDETHFANTTRPAIPAALSGIVSGFRGLDNFRPKSQAHRAQPDYTFPVTGGNLHFIAPGDITTMYDLGALYAAGIDGTGQKLAVIGQTDVYLDDLADFRSGFGLSAINCTTNATNVITACNTSNFRYVVITGDTDPGAPDSIGDDLPEADIDIQWSGATARNAQIIYVNAPDPTGSGIYDSMYYTIDNNVAPVMTMSYTFPCELAEAQSGFFAADEAEFQMGNSEGITFMNSSGDTGAAECDYGNNTAIHGYAVAYPASSPAITGVGGTLIPWDEYTATYWGTTNGTDGGSALKYVPEEVWNDAQEWNIFCTNNASQSTCRNNPGFSSWTTAQESLVGLVAGGGGVSNCVVVDLNGVCTSGIPQPSYQAGLNLSALNPGGGGQTNTPARLSPDVSLLASIYWPGYIVCTAANELIGGSVTTSSCSPGGAAGIVNDLSAPYGFSWGGTSISSPIFAGIVTLLNQEVVASHIQTTPGLGNINPMLYTLAAANSTNKAFNPVTPPNTGAYSDGAWCSAGTPTSGVPADPWPAALQCPSSGANAGFVGFDAFNSDSTTGYNLATGLGSVDAGNLFTAWVAASLAATATTVTSSQNPANFGVSVTFTATVTTTGSTLPTGTVTFNDGATALGTGTISTVGGFQVATFATSTLAVGTHSITAVYGGDANNAGSTSAILSQVIVAPTFTLSTPTTPRTALSGQATTSTFTVTATGGHTTFTDAVTFACNGLPDTTVSCAFSTIAQGASSPQTVTLTISTIGPNSGTAGPQQRRADNRSPWLPLTLPLAGIVMVAFAGRKMSKHSAIAGLCISLALLGLLVACGGSNPPVAISVTPAGATVFASGPAGDNWPPQTASFTPTVTNSSNMAVNWSLSSTVSCTGTPSPCGSITSAGVYTAPTAAAGLPGSVTVTATAQADTTKTATATVTIKPTTVPGSYPLTVTATEGPTQNTTSVFTLTVK